MESFKLTLTERDATGKVLNGAKSAPVTFGMKFVQPLSGSRSLYHFRIDLTSSATPLDFYVDSVNASGLFECLNNVFYGQATDSAQLEIADSAGNPSGKAAVTISIALAVPPINFTTYPTTVKVCTFTIAIDSGKSTTFMVANTDTSAMQWYMDAMLMSNPPSPPR